jgi:hypothetical protein
MVAGVISDMFVVDDALRVGVGGNAARLRLGSTVGMVPKESILYAAPSSSPSDITDDTSSGGGCGGAADMMSMLMKLLLRQKKLNQER